MISVYISHPCHIFRIISTDNPGSQMPVSHHNRCSADTTLIVAVVHLHNARNIIFEDSLIKLSIYILILGLLKHIIELAEILLRSCRLHELYPLRINNCRIQPAYLRKCFYQSVPSISIQISVIFLFTWKLFVHNIRKLVFIILLSLINAAFKILSLCYVCDKVLHCI